MKGKLSWIATTEFFRGPAGECGLSREVVPAARTSSLLEYQSVSKPFDILLGASKTHLSIQELLAVFFLRDPGNSMRRVCYERRDMPNVNLKTIGISCIHFVNCLN